MNDMADKLKNCAKDVLTTCLKVGRHDSVLVIFDKFGQGIAEAFSRAAIESDCDITLRYVIYEEQKHSSDIDRYLNNIRQSIASSNVLIFAVTDADECTRFRIKILGTAVTNASKILHLPGVSEEMFVDSSYELDFSKLQKSGHALLRTINENEDIEISTKTSQGTSHILRLSTKGRRGHICGGIAQPGQIMNIPTGEVYIAPVENSAHGSLVLNGSGPNCVFRPPEEIILNFKEGVLDIEKSYFPDEPNSKRLLEQVLTPAKNWGTSNITLGEFGIGLNASVQNLTGNVIMDEKAGGTAHIALGANIPFGGQLDGQVHYDLVFIPTSIKVGKESLKVEWRKTK